MTGLQTLNLPGPLEKSLFRRTFLRSHVAGTLVRPSDDQDTAQRIDIDRDLLALQSLRADVETAWKSTQVETGPYDAPLRMPSELQRRLWKLTSPRHFFGIVRPEESSDGEPTAGSEKPELRLYQPVPVRVLDPPADMPIRFDNLSCLLAVLTRDWSRRVGRRGYGVLLQSRSGAGKTVACWKAWYDCLDVDSLQEEDARPVLAGSVPCWIRSVSPDEVGELRKHTSDPMDLVLLLLGRAAGLITDVKPLISTVPNESLEQTRDRIASYCAFGPRLLIFADLNHFEPGLRRELAMGLVEFQKRHADQHCCVVTYRSAVRGDETSTILNESNHFLSVDLEPLLPSVATAYLRNFRQFEQELLKTLSREFPDLPVPVRDVDDECALLERLIERTQKRGEPLISTPLMMHWAAELSNDDLRKTHNITHLYRHVVARHVARHADDLARLMHGGDESLITAMTRIALLIQAGDNQVRVPIERAKAALTNPHGDRGTKTSWWPEADFWWKNPDAPEDGSDGLYPYYHVEFSKGGSAQSDCDPERNQVDRMLEYGLFRRDEDQLGFVHDSLIAYFSSVALREYLGPRNPDWHQNVEPDDQAVWLHHTYERIMAAPDRWTQAVEFLAGALEPLPVGRSAPEPVWLDSAKAMQHKAVTLAQVFALSGPSEATLRLTYHAARGASRILVLDLMARAIEERRALLNRKPHLLPQVIQHFFNHLVAQQADEQTADGEQSTAPDDLLLSDPPVRNVARLFEEQFLHVRRNLIPDGTPWLRLIGGSRSSAVLHFSDDFDAAVTAVLAVRWPVSGEVDEEWVLAGLANGELHLWNPRSGALHCVGRHAPPEGADENVACEIILLRQEADGLIHSADDRGGFRVWTPLSRDTPQMRMRIVADTGGELTSVLRGFPQFRDQVVTPRGDIAGLDDDGRLHLFRGHDSSKVSLGDDLSDINEHQKGLSVLASGQIVTTRGGCLKIIERDAGILEPLFSTDFSIDRITVRQECVAVWEDYGKRILVWDARTDSSRRLYEVGEPLRGVGLLDDGLLIAVTQEQVLRIDSDDNRVVLYPPTEAELEDDDNPWTCIESCWCTQDVAVMGDDSRVIGIPLTTQGEQILAAIPGIPRRGNGYVLFTRNETSHESINQLVWIAEVGVVSVWSDGSICITGLEGDTTRLEFEESPLSDAKTLHPGPLGSVLITDDDQLWQFNTRSRVLTPVAREIWYSIPGGFDLQDRVYAASREGFWRVNSDGDQAELLCNMDSTANTSIEGMHVTAGGHVLIAASNGFVYRWRSDKANVVDSARPNDAAVAPSEAVLCPRVTLLRVDEKPGVVVTDQGTITGSSNITCLANGATVNELFVGCDNGDVYRWQFDGPSGQPLQHTLVASLNAEQQRNTAKSDQREADAENADVEQDADETEHSEVKQGGRVDLITSSSHGDVFVVTHCKVNKPGRWGKSTDEIYTLWAVVDENLMSEPLWTSNVKVVFLACDEDGNLIAITGDGGSPSLFLRWTRLRAEDGGRSRVIFQQVTLLDGEQDDAEIGVSLQDSGAVVAWGRQTLAFVDKENECRLSAFDPTRPVPRLKKDDRGIVTFVDGSTVEDSVAVSGDVLLRFGPGGREQLHEIAPVLFDVDYRDDPREMPSWIKKAFRDPLGNVALATSTGHVYYHNAVTGELTVLSEPEVREGGSPSTPHKRTIAIDAQGRVLDWFEDPDDRKGWRLYVWQHGDETAREVFEYRVEYVKRSESVTASTLLPNGDLIFTTHFRRGDERKYRSDRPAQRGAWSAVCRVSADRWNETVQVFEMEWDDPWARMWICSVAEWSCGRLLLGFENGRIAVLHLPVSNDSTGTARLEWLSRNHGSQRVVHLRAVNDSCFASASASQLQIGTANDVLLEYRSDEGIRDFVYMPGQQPQTYVNEGTGTLLEVVGDVSQFLPE